mmetsp:Transcript_24948/g.51839  ORF Transcript_24948/g.51839 Transcript_24948/m.51839 type:complete len:201 (+) Transcript_24948:900-1502(+)
MPRQILRQRRPHKHQRILQRNPRQYLPLDLRHKHQRNHPQYLQLDPQQQRQRVLQRIRRRTLQLDPQRQRQRVPLLIRRRFPLLNRQPKRQQMALLTARLHLQLLHLLHLLLHQLQHHWFIPRILLQVPQLRVRPLLQHSHPQFLQVLSHLHRPVRLRQSLLPIRRAPHHLCLPPCHQPHNPHLVHRILAKPFVLMGYQF